MIIESAKKSGQTAVFKVDADGARLYNSRFDLVSGYTSDGVSHIGQIGLVPNVGIVAGDVSGEDSIYQYDDDSGEIIGVKVTGGSKDYVTTLDLLGASEKPKANLWADMHGNVYLKRTVYADAGKFSGDITGASGTFTGVVQASDFRDASGKSMLTTGGKIDSGYLDLGNIQLDGETGDITMAGNINLSQGNINWGSNTPVQYQFSVDGVSNWHPVMTVSDKYRKDSLDGGLTWGDAYQFVGTDGQDGSDADVPSYIKRTYIDGSSVTSPVIRGGIISGAKFSDLNQNYNLVMDYSPSTANSSAMNLTNSDGSSVFSVYEDGFGTIALRGKNLNPFMTVSSEDNDITTVANGTWDFSDANVLGVVAVFGA